MIYARKGADAAANVPAGISADAAIRAHAAKVAHVLDHAPAQVRKGCARKPQIVVFRARPGLGFFYRADAVL
jgi:hypothetical protein